MAIIWPYPSSLSSYVMAGQQVAVPPQRCPSCVRWLVGWGGYWRWLRAPLLVERIWIRRGRCSACRRSHALLPDLVLVRRLDGVERAVAGEAFDRRLAGLGVLARVAHLLGPRHEAIVELLETADALGFGLEQEPLADVAPQSLLLAAALRLVRSAMNQPDPQHSAAPLECRIGIRRAVVDVQLLGQTAPLNGRAQHLLTGASVLIRNPAAMHQKPAKVIDEQEQMRATAALHARVGYERTDEYVAYPALVRSFSFETTKDAWLTSDSGAMQALPAQMLADGAVWQEDAVPSFQDRADLGS